MYKVMLVDDEYMILEGLKRIIPWEELGFEIVATAKSATQALDYFTDHEIDVLITDVTMPEMSGIQLVERMKQQGKKVVTLILSGYQEFEYVKQGIDLGVKNYLVKPVDKKELAANMRQIKEELDQEQQLAEQLIRFRENGLARWLNDELNEAEFQLLMEQYQAKNTGPYTVLQFKVATKSEGEKLVVSHQENQQKFYLSSVVSHGEQSFLIYQGTAAQLHIYLHQLKQQIPKLQILVGETVEDWENVYESYEKVKKLLLFQAFYPDSVGTLLNEGKASQPLSFLSFNKALMIGDKHTLQAELDMIFQQMIDTQAAPETVRYVTFLLCTDIYRQYSSIPSELYEETLKKIPTSENISELKGWLERLLESIQQSPGQKRYSEMVQQVLDILAERYMEDLTVKSVAEELHVNAVYLGQLFKKETERSFAQFLNQIRMKKAQNLLLYTTDTINEIAEETGYNNTNYFSKMFKKLNGLSPKEFRDKYEKNYHSVE